jgi:hypothetical protein
MHPLAIKARGGIEQKRRRKRQGDSRKKKQGETKEKKTERGERKGEKQR